MRLQRVLMSTDAVGGVWTYALDMAACLAEHGIDVLLVVLGPAPSVEQRRNAARIPRLVLTHVDYPLEWAPGGPAQQSAAGEWLLGLARDWQPDVVHLNHYSHGHLPWGVPCVVVAHSCVFSWFHHVRKALPDDSWTSYRDAVTRGLRGADAVVAPSAAMLADVQRFYGPLGRAEMIPNGREPDVAMPLHKRPYVFCAGRLWDEAKNIELIRREALSLSWPLHLAGEVRHPDGGQLPKWSAGRGVRLLGTLGSAAMAQAYGHASIYVLPARYEPFGLSALEAALAGCALVLSDIASLRENWSGVAEFADPDDGLGFRQAIERLIADPELRRRRARDARARARRFSARGMARNYLRLYADLQQQRELQPCAS
ncbi:MAG: glycosyltransferase family 4 protein [Dyella sp.]|uniref:glycosyltransferase family 4 protein n=1 Tax=Dyella sp. TaxID=1869338 RepID=UPI003F7EE035